MARLHPCGHNNSSLGGQICFKLDTHILQTTTKDEFEFGGRTYFSDFSRIFFIQQRVTKLALLHPCGHDDSSLGGYIFIKLGTHMLQTIPKDEFEFGGRTYFPDFSRIFSYSRGCKMARLHPCGHDNVSSGGHIFTKLGTHMLQTITKNEFEFGGRTYFSDFSRIFFVQQGSQKRLIYTFVDRVT